MKKFLCLTMVFLLVLSLVSMPASAAYEPEYVGTVYASNSTCYINNYPIPCYIMDDYMFVQVEDLNNYGFDVKWNAYNETLRIMKDDQKPFDGLLTHRPFAEEIGEKLFDMNTTFVRTYIGDYGYEIECLSGMPGCTYINVDNLSVFGKMDWVDEDEAMYITTSNPDGVSYPLPVRFNPDRVPWFDCGDETSLDGHDHYYDFSYWNYNDSMKFTFGCYSEYQKELSACSFCYGTFYADIYDTEGRKVYNTSKRFYYTDWEKNYEYLAPYFIGDSEAPVGYELNIPNSKLKKGGDYMAHLTFWCNWCDYGYEEKIYFTTPDGWQYLPSDLYVNQYL